MRFFEKLAAEMVEGSDPIARVLSAPTRYITKLMLYDKRVSQGSPKDISKKTKDTVKRITKNDKDLKIYVGNSPIVDQMSRALKGKGTAYSHPILRPIGALSAGMGGLLGKLSGGDYYNPSSHAISLKSDIGAIGAHEAGHAADFKKIKYPTLYGIARNVPGVDLYQEHKASKWAGKKLKTDKDLEILTPAMASYVSKYLGPASVIPGMVAGHLVKGSINYKEKK